MNARSTLFAAGIFGAIGVGLGALGAHALEPFLAEKGMAHAWDTAARYHMIHAIALLAIAVWRRSDRGAAARRAGWAAWCWTAGIVLFSGSLYGLALGGPRWLGPITPLGGIALMAGWVCVAAAAFAKNEE